MREYGFGCDASRMMGKKLGNGSETASWSVGEYMERCVAAGCRRASPGG